MALLSRRAGFCVVSLLTLLYGCTEADGDGMMLTGVGATDQPTAGGLGPGPETTAAVTPTASSIPSPVASPTTPPAAAGPSLSSPSVASTQPAAPSSPSVTAPEVTEQPSAAGGGVSDPIQPASGGSGGNSPGAGGAEGGAGTPSMPMVEVGPCPESASLSSGDTTMTVDVDGTERSFLVHAPPAYDGETRLPVVFDFHGLTGTSSQQKSLSRWDTVGDSEGFIVVYPQGIDNAWNAGQCCSDTTSDVAFVRAIIDTLAAQACVDTKRVYASGCSNGGGMSYRLACEAADVITAVAPVDFDCVLGSECGDCQPSRPVSVVQFRGTNDQLVNYDGDGPFTGAKDNLAIWGGINECSDSPSPVGEAEGCESYSSCGEGAETVLCTVQGGTHCGSYSSFMIPEVAWEVLKHHALP